MKSLEPTAAAGAEEVYRSCFRASAAPLMLARPSGEILEVSEGAELLFGYHPGELLQQRRQTVLLQEEAVVQALAGATNREARWPK